MVDASDSGHQRPVGLPGIRTLLGCFCDASVVLDGELHLIEPADKFASLLMMPGRDLQGDDFCRHLAHHSQDSFKSFVQNVSTEAACEHGKVFHAVLIDPAGIEISVRVYHALWDAQMGVVGHLLAIVDHSEADGEEHQALLPGPQLSAPPVDLIN